MSGDVQPRKRKDKRKKKDENLDYLNSNPEDIIHVQKDAFLGGNICTKVVFFCLLGALGVMVSLLIFEYRGSNDLETQSAVDSPWSQMLEGWVDTNVDEHHDDHPDDGDDDDDDDDDRPDHDAGSKKDDNDDNDDNDKGIEKDHSNKEDKKSKKKSKSKKKGTAETDDEIVEKTEEIPEQEVDEDEEVEETSGGAGDSKIEKDVVATNESIPAVPKPETPELLSRRKTLVPPSLTEDIHPSRSPSPPLDEYSEGEEEEEDEEEGEEGAVESEQVKQTLEDLKAAYAGITPEPSDIEEDYEADAATKPYDYTPPESEPELSEPDEEEEAVGDEEDEEEEEEEDNDEPRSEWQSKQSAHLLAEEIEDLQTESETEEEESDDEPPPPPVVRRRGPQEIDENEQIFQDLVYETFEKVEQPLEQYSAKADEPEESENRDNENAVNDEVNQNDEQEDLWEPLSSTESFNEAVTGNEKVSEEMEQPAESEGHQEGVKDYFNGDITNDYDWEIHDDLDAADAELNQGDFNFI